MSTPIFDALYAESDDTTRALVEKAQLVAQVMADIERLTVVPHKNSDQVRGDGLLGGLEL